MNRRQVLASIPVLLFGLPALAKENRVEPLVKPKSEWKTLLPAMSYNVLFEEDTERPGTSPLNTEKRAGTFVCAACYLPLFSSETKYDSGTGWPSFFDTLPGAVGTKKDRKLFLPRTEYHCIRCGGSQAQCDLVHLTLVESALRSGHTPMARSLVAERIESRPRSAFNRYLMARVGGASGTHGSGQ